MTTNKDQVKGRVKEAVGSVTGDEELKREGEADQAAGDVKEFVEDVADKAGDLVRDVKDAVHKQ